MFQDLVYIILLIVLTFLLRILPHILRILPPDSDQIYHAYAAEEIRKNKFKYPKKFNGCLLPGIYDYPPLFHYILAVFPRDAREKVMPFISAIIDCFHVLILYLFLLNLKQNFAELKDWSTYSALLIFCTSPLLIYFGSGPRAFHATPRTLGEFLLTVCFISLSFYMDCMDPKFLILSSFTAALIFLTSKFASQCLVFFSIVISLLSFSYIPLFCMLLGFLIAHILSFGYYRNVFIGWIKHLILYRKIQKIAPVTKHRNNPRYIYTGIKNCMIGLAKRDKQEFFKNLHEVIQNFTPILLILRDIILFPTIYLIYTQWETISSNNFLLFLSYWIFASLIVFFLTSLEPFLFLGEAERYIEHSFAPQVIIFSIFIENTIFIYAVLLYHAVFYIYTLITMRSINMHFDKKSKKELIDWILSKKIEGKKFLTIHMKMFYIPYLTNNAILLPPANYTFDEKYYREVFEEPYYPNRDVNKLVEKYSIDYIIVNKKCLEYAMKKGYKYDLSKFKKVYENRRFVVYEVVNWSKT